MEQIDQDRTREAVLALVRSVPLGRVATAGRIASALSLPVSRVEGVLSRLEEPERSVVPWYRVVPETGNLADGGTPVDEQRRLLGFEGVNFDGMAIRDFRARLVTFPRRPAD